MIEKEIKRLRKLYKFYIYIGNDKKAEEILQEIDILIQQKKELKNKKLW